MLSNYAPMCRTLISNEKQGIVWFDVEQPVLINNVELPLADGVRQQILSAINAHDSDKSISLTYGIPRNAVAALRRNNMAEVNVKAPVTYMLGQLLQIIAADPVDAEQTLFRCATDVEKLLVSIAQIANLACSATSISAKSKAVSPFAGYYTIDNRTVYFSSKLDAKYATWLQANKEAGKITSWAYKSHAFDSKSGAKWKPDFCIDCADGTQYFADVVGWRTAKFSKALRAVQSEYPLMDIRIIGVAWFKQHADEIKHLFSDKKWTPASVWPEIARVNL